MYICVPTYIKEQYLSWCCNFHSNALPWWSSIMSYPNFFNLCKLSFAHHTEICLQLSAYNKVTKIVTLILHNFLICWQALHHIHQPNYTSISQLLRTCNCSRKYEVDAYKTIFQWEGVHRVFHCCTQFKKQAHNF